MTNFDPGRLQHSSPSRHKTGDDLAGFQEGKERNSLGAGFNSPHGSKDAGGRGAEMRDRQNRFASSLQAQLDHGKNGREKEGAENDDGVQLLARVMPKKEGEHAKSEKPGGMDLPMQLSFMNPEGDGVLMTVKVHVDPKPLAPDMSKRIEHVAKIVGDQINATLRMNIDGAGKEGIRFDIKVQDKGMALNGISVHSQGNVVTVTMRTVEGALDPETLNALAASLASSLSTRFPKKVIEIAGRVDGGHKEPKHPEKGSGDEIAALLSKR
jgi:hypothetical protein